MSNKNIVTIDTIKEYLENNSNSKLISNTYINAKDNGIELLRISFKDSNIDNILKSKIW